MNNSTDSAVMNMLNPYELARETRVARMHKICTDVKVCETAADFVTSFSDTPKLKEARALKVKGCDQEEGQKSKGYAQRPL